MATFPNTRISWPNDVSFKKRNLVAARDRAKKRLAAEIGHPSLHRGIGQRQVDLPIEPLDDFGRSAAVDLNLSQDTCCCSEIPARRPTINYIL